MSDPGRQGTAGDARSGPRQQDVARIARDVADREGALEAHGHVRPGRTRIEETRSELVSGRVRFVQVVDRAPEVRLEVAAAERRVRVASAVGRDHIRTRGVVVDDVHVPTVDGRRRRQVVGGEVEREEVPGRAHPARHRRGEGLRAPGRQAPRTDREQHLALGVLVARV